MSRCWIGRQSESTKSDPHSDGALRTRPTILAASAAGKSTSASTSSNIGLALKKAQRNDEERIELLRGVGMIVTVVQWCLAQLLPHNVSVHRRVSTQLASAASVV